jgi:hypothetical protein
MGLSAVDQLLLFLLEGKRRVAAQMMSVGFSETEMRDAWDQALAAGFTESTGLGQDRLTEKGRARANELR